MTVECDNIIVNVH